MASSSQAASRIEERRWSIGAGPAQRIHKAIQPEGDAGKGIETVLSLRQILPAMPMIAALSAAHLTQLRLPPTLRRLYIARDNDAAGRKAGEELATRAQEAGIEPLMLGAKLGDFNDDLRQLGKEALRADVRVQLAPDDAERLCA